MNHPVQQKSQPSLDGSSTCHASAALSIGAAASWQLGHGRVLSLCPRGSGVLRVTGGRVWATLDLSPTSRPADVGDHFVRPGHDLPLRAGQRVVLESWPVAGADRIEMAWMPLRQTDQPGGRHSIALLQHWRAGGLSVGRLLMRWIGLSTTPVARCGAGQPWE